MMSPERILDYDLVYKALDCPALTSFIATFDMEKAVDENRFKDESFEPSQEDVLPFFSMPWSTLKCTVNREP